MNFVNLCPHPIHLNDGREFPAVAPPARVQAVHSTPDENGIMTVTFGEIEGLPAPEAGTTFIGSLLVVQAAAAKGRTDVVAPASSHPDTIREGGQVKSVPGFVRA